MIPQKPLILCILDGWGLSSERTGNAPLLANTPTLDYLMSKCPNAKLITHGPDVGLPIGQMGNSEVGHTNIGAGRVVSMDLGKIDQAILDNSLFQNSSFKNFISELQTNKGTAHLIGVISDGGVHGHINHLLSVMNYIATCEVPVILHLITDGRDVAPKSVLSYVSELSNLKKGISIGTCMGRFFAMDRDNRWDRTKEAIDAIIFGLGNSAITLREGLNAAYDNEEADEFIKPIIINDYEGLKSGDGVFILNFRADRARQLTDAIANPNFDKFNYTHKPVLGPILGMTDYSENHSTFMAHIFSKEKLENTLGSWVAKHGLKQLRIAETEKYAHVTFFLNGGKELAEDNEDRQMFNSPKVLSYDTVPEMSAEPITNKILEAMDLNYSLIVANYANPDMVGHTGNLKAAIKACETVDLELNKILKKVTSKEATLLIIADHGNCEEMTNLKTGNPHTSHTLNLVPICLFGAGNSVEIQDGRLADVAPTILELMQLKKPLEMTGKSLISGFIGKP